MAVDSVQRLRGKPLHKRLINDFFETVVYRQAKVGVNQAPIVHDGVPIISMKLLTRRLTQKEKVVLMPLTDAHACSIF